MKELKFRAWNGEKMLNRELTDRNWYTHDNKCVCGARPKDKTELSIMQFTGLTDKNGVEIYEGDILKTPSKEMEWYEVKFEDAKYCLYHKYGRWGDLSRLFELDGVNGFTIEVIGNIHHNKDLL